MAAKSKEDNKKSSVKKVPDTKSKKTKTSLRERNKKAAEQKDKPKRIRKAATNASKPVSKAADVLTKEFHVMPQKENAGFFTKSRRLLPPYFYNSLAELKNVSWPGRRETWKLVFAVFVFAIVLGIFVAVLDFGLEKVFKEIIL